MDKDAFSRRGIKTTRLCEKIFIIHGANRGRSPFSHAVCVLDKRSVLVDAGCGLDIIRKISEAVHIDLVILSHSHLDHTAGTWLLKEISKADVLVPAQSSESIGCADKLATRFVGSGLAPCWMDIYPPLTGFKDFTFTSGYGNAFELVTGSHRFIAMHTPGHLADHYCLWEPDEKILFGFDIDLSPFGPWYGSPESDINLFKESIAMIGRLPVELYVSSHARPVKPPYFLKRLAAYDSVFDERDRLLIGSLPKEGWTDIEEVVAGSPIYETDYVLHPDPILKFAERQMIEKHLFNLAGAGVLDHDVRAGFRRRA